MDLLPNFFRIGFHANTSPVRFNTLLLRAHTVQVAGSDIPFPFGAQQPVCASEPVTANCSWTVKTSQAFPSGSVN